MGKQWMPREEKRDDVGNEMQIREPGGDKEQRVKRRKL